MYLKKYGQMMFSRASSSINCSSYILNCLFASLLSCRQTAQANFSFEDWQGRPAQLPHLNNRHIHSEGESILPTSCRRIKVQYETVIIHPTVSLLFTEVTSVLAACLCLKKNMIHAFFLAYSTIHHRITFCAIHREE